jgi:hypothetical protein
MKYLIKNILSVSILTGSLLACENDGIPKEQFPVLITESVTEIQEGTATLNGRFHDEGLSPIVSYGFIWTPMQSPNHLYAEKIEVGTSPTSNRFEASITFGMEKGKQYFVYSYAKTDKQISYGNIQQFISNGCQEPAIIDFSPTVAQPGSVVTINGENFSTVNALNQVKFGTFTATVLESSPTQLTVIVPEALNVQSVPISITIFGILVQSDQNFSLP